MQILQSSPKVYNGKALGLNMRAMPQWRLFLRLLSKVARLRDNES